MQCPVCDGVALVMSERQGIEVDYCPKCRGVWLDRGELDKIIERSAAEPAARREPEYRAERPRQYDERPRHYDERDERHRHGKRRGLLGDLFDFD